MKIRLVIYTIALVVFARLTAYQDHKNASFGWFCLIFSIITFLIVDYLMDEEDDK